MKESDGNCLLVKKQSKYQKIGESQSFAAPVSGLPSVAAPVSGLPSVSPGAQSEPPGIASMLDSAGGLGSTSGWSCSAGSWSCHPGREWQLMEKASTKNSLALCWVIYFDYFLRMEKLKKYGLQKIVKDLCTKVLMNFFLHWWGILISPLLQCLCQTWSEYPFCARTQTPSQHEHETMHTAKNKANQYVNTSAQQNLSNTVCY